MIRRAFETPDRITSKNPADQVDVVNQTVVKDSPGYLKIFHGRKRRISGACFDNVNGSDIAGANGVEESPIGRVKAPVETAHQHFADLRGK